MNHIPAKLTPDILYIEHDDDGLELFRTSDAGCNLSKKDGVWELTFSCRASEPIQRSEDLVDVMPDAQPHFEATALLAEHDIELKPGRVILQKEGYDHRREVNLSNFYYSSHESVEEVQIELVEVTREYILARFSGYSPYGGAKLAALTRFKRGSAYGRGIQ